MPVTEWNKINHDFGTVPAGKTYDCQFVYNGDYEIDKITTSCGCTAATKDGKVVSVKYKLSGVVGQSRQKIITVYFKDRPKTEFQRLTVRAKIAEK